VGFCLHLIDGEVSSLSLSLLCNNSGKGGVTFTFGISKQKCLTSVSTPGIPHLPVLSISQKSFVAPGFRLHTHFTATSSALHPPYLPPSRPRHALVRPSGRGTRLEPQCLPNGINTLFGNANDLFFNPIPIDSVLPSSLLNFCRGVGCVHIVTYLLLCWTEIIDSFQCFVRVQPHLITMIPRHRLRATALLTQMPCKFPLLPGQTQMIRLYIPQIECRSLPDHYLCFIIACPCINSLLTLSRRAALIQTYQEDLCIKAWPAIMW
jgi:hypothetical protein